MISTWRKRRAERRARKELPEGKTGEIEILIPNHFRCPISLDLMKDPVTLSTGITYDRESIEKWIEAGNDTCPITKGVLRSLEPTPNHTIRKMVQDWCVENRSYGIERIPTPRIPVSSFEVKEMKSKILVSSKGGDRVLCQNLVAKIKGLIKESERNKRCVVSNGMSLALCSAMEDFSRADLDANVAVLEEILSCLTLISPVDAESMNHLSSAAAMDCLVWFLKSGDLSRRRNSVMMLKEIVSADQIKAVSLSRIEGAMEALFKLIKEPISPAATKASMVTIYHMVTSPSPTNPMIIKKFVDMGLVSSLLETIVDSERSVCEKALAVLDGICGCDKGREDAYSHGLSIPVIVKKIHRVSDLATEFSVSILWQLCKGEKRENGGVLVEALQVGAFQKLLLLLQVGCGDRTKEKATELLKLLNPYRKSVECIDSMDFKDLKRPF